MQEPLKEKSKVQKFEIQQINRADIKNAPYNPRKISKHAKRKLKDNLERVGLLEPVVINKNTGNLVSGHQRLACIDIIEGSPGYSLDVSLVNLTEQEEKEQNIFFNNTFVMGDWDLEVLSTMFKDPDFSIEKTGFDKLDLQIVFPELVPTEQNLFATENMPEETKEDLKEISRMKEERKKHKEKVRKRDDTEFYLVAVFASRERKEEFLMSIDYDPTMKYVDGEILFTAVDPMVKAERLSEQKETDRKMTQEQYEALVNSVEEPAREEATVEEY